mgnify:CR=1 FL=1
MIRVGTAAVELQADDGMVIAGGIEPRFARGQEGRLRATALVVEGAERLCIVSCDILMAGRDLLDEACRRIEAACGIPCTNILVAATHTHHAPSTVVVHG